MNSAAAISYPNIAFIKYWGNRDPILRIPANGSISMNLQGLTTRTQVTFAPDLPADQLTLNDQTTSGIALQRVSQFLDHVRKLSGKQWFAQVESENNFPTGAGIASSASAFAALSLAASRAAGLTLSETGLSRLARRGSGSACRSVPGGFVEWQAGDTDQDSYAYSLAPAEHWKLADCVAIVSQQHKETGSFQGHALADTSPLQTARLSSAGTTPGAMPAGCPATRFRLPGAGDGAGQPPDARRDDHPRPTPALLATRHTGRHARRPGMAQARTGSLFHHRCRSQCTRPLPGRGCRPSGYKTGRNSWRPKRAFRRSWRPCFLQ